MHRASDGYSNWRSRVLAIGVPEGFANWRETGYCRQRRNTVDRMGFNVGVTVRTSGILAKGVLGEGASHHGERLHTGERVRPAATPVPRGGLLTTAGDYIL